MVCVLPVTELPGCVLEDYDELEFEEPKSGVSLTKKPKSVSQHLTKSNSQKLPNHLTRSNSQSDFAKQHQTAIVLDWEDTLFPTTFVKNSTSLSPYQDVPDSPAAKNELKHIEECQVAAEALLRCTLEFGRPVIVTLAGRDRMKKQCERWYPRFWKLLKDSQINVVFATEVHQALLKKDKDKAKDAKVNYDNFAEADWIKVKGKAISLELNRVYSQYKGQTWKNVIAFGDSTIEIFGTMGAVNAYVQKNFAKTSTSESQAYDEVQNLFKSYPLQRFDGDPCWSRGFNGVHDNRNFHVRTKVVKLLAQPSSARIVQQLSALTQMLPSIVRCDGCLNLFLDDKTEETVDVEFLESKMQILLNEARNAALRVKQRAAF